MSDRPDVNAIRAQWEAGLLGLCFVNGQPIHPTAIAAQSEHIRHAATAVRGSLSPINMARVSFELGWDSAILSDEIQRAPTDIETLLAEVERLHKVIVKYQEGVHDEFCGGDFEDCEMCVPQLHDALTGTRETPK